VKVRRSLLRNISDKPVLQYWLWGERGFNFFSLYIWWFVDLEEIFGVLCGVVVYFLVNILFL